MESCKNSINTQKHNFTKSQVSQDSSHCVSLFVSESLRSTPKLELEAVVDGLTCIIKLKLE